MNIFSTSLTFPCGQLLIACSHEGVERIFFGPTPEISETTLLQEYFPGAILHHIAASENVPACCAQVRAELQEYFAGSRQVFTCPFVLRGTPFQQQVWEIVRHIPYGATRTYGQIAEMLGDKKLSRAVGLANGANPLPILLPCHRVIGKQGALTGYGGGLAMKQYLLRLEGAVLL